jgi:hypothetical protein
MVCRMMVDADQTRQIQAAYSAANIEKPGE